MKKSFTLTEWAHEIACWKYGGTADEQTDQVLEIAIKEEKFRINKVKSEHKVVLNSGV